MLQRHLQAEIEEGLKHFPVVLITGSRQVGKSTLAQALMKARPGRYLTLDDRSVLDSALLDPDGFIDANPTPLIIDEIQRAPDLMRAIKRVVDRDRRPGMYLLTGSANVMTLGSVSETLAGRVAVFELQPFSWSETAKRPRPEILSDIFKVNEVADLIKNLSTKTSKSDSRQIKELILRGGYPTPALMASAPARRQWFSSYRTTYIERDLRDLANIAHLPDFGRLIRIAASRTAQLFNLSDISREVGLPLSTLRRYLNLLQLTYQVFLLPPYYVNIGKRLVKMPKLYFGDTGMAMHLSGIESFESAQRLGRSGFLMETWVWSEIRKLIEASDPSIGLYYWRTATGHEVDFVLEKEDHLVAIEVKSAQRLGASDISALSEFSRLLGKRVHLKIILYSGSEPIGIDRSTVALPFGTFFGV